ncbi:MAG TPA: DNA polymerase Y family protein [Polyangiaceae bacterium]|nr:DNA polymerase Y family protein [Polyangiaceae bacterium]
MEAVNGEAQRLGVRRGQTVAEARAITARLDIQQVSRSAIEHGLARVAEIALAFGAVVSFEMPDTVWVDITGAAHLLGGETALLAELVSRVREAGHLVRGAVSVGPLLARALARFGTLSEEGFIVVPSAHTARSLAPLPLKALNLTGAGLNEEVEGWLIRLGVLNVGELLALPRAALATRLGKSADSVLTLAQGVDATPLTPYAPPRTISEQAQFEEALTITEPLLFVLRGLCARVSARLAGRGEAAFRLALELQHDPGIARFRNTQREVRLPMTLPKPIWNARELYRLLATKLERYELAAPCVGIRLEASELVGAMPRQLELGFGGSHDAVSALAELPLVIAELAADVGEDRVGVLRAVDAHRPELTSELRPAFADNADSTQVSKSRSRRADTTRGPIRSNVASKPRHSTGLHSGSAPHAEALPSPQVASLPVKHGETAEPVHRVTRLLKEPVPLHTALRTGATLVLGHRMYTIESLRFAQRLHAVEWWSQSISRDYVRVVLKGSDGVLEGLVYVDRDNGKRYFQGVAD